MRTHEADYFTDMPSGFKIGYEWWRVMNEQLRPLRHLIAKQQDAMKSEMEEARTALGTALLTVLSPQQRAAMDELLGSPLDLPHQAPRAEADQPGSDLQRLVTVLQLPSTRNDLELLDEQSDKLAELFGHVKRQRVEILLRQKQAEEKESRLGKRVGFSVEVEFVRLRREVDGVLAEVLLPHQHKRLRQIQLQLEIREETPVPLLSRTIARELNLSEQQVAAVKKMYVAESQKARNKADALYKESLDAVLATLTSDQQRRYRTLVGSPFEGRGK